MAYAYAFVYYLSMVAWLLPLLRQYKSNLFLFFFVLALSDPLTFLISKHSPLTTIHITPIACYLALFVLSDPLNAKNLKKIFLAFIGVFGLLSSFYPWQLAYIYASFSHSIILFIFIKRALIFVAENGRVNLFHMVLILYETSIILKVVAFLTDLERGFAFFMITNIFQIFIAGFFIIYREDNPNLLVNLKNE